MALVRIDVLLGCQFVFWLFTAVQTRRWVQICIEILLRNVQSARAWEASKWQSSFLFLRAHHHGRLVGFCASLALAGIHLRYIFRFFLFDRCNLGCWRRLKLAKYFRGTGSLRWSGSHHANLPEWIIDFLEERGIRNRTKVRYGAECSRLRSMVARLLILWRLGVIQCTVKLI